MKDYYLLTTDHLENCLWFRDDSDFKVAMNYVAIQVALCPEVNLLSFILMSNHVHFVLYGTKDDVICFITLFKRRYSAYYRKKHNVKEFLRRNNVDVKPLSIMDESLERAIAYVQMNCVAANVCSHPSQYPWGTGNIFFSRTPISGTRLGDMSTRARRRLLNSNCENLPEYWIIGEDGFIKPQSYVDIKDVEFIFRTPKRLNYFLNSSSKAKKRLQTVEDNLPAFRDQSIMGTLPDLCRSLFHKHSIEELQEDEQIELLRQIRFRFSADANQIARVCGISYARAAYLLDKA